jgi:hypothetical protein
MFGNASVGFPTSSRNGGTRVHAESTSPAIVNFVAPTYIKPSLWDTMFSSIYQQFIVANYMNPMAVAAFLASIKDEAIVLSHQPLQLLFYLGILVPTLYVLVNEIIRRSVRIPKLGGPTGLPLIGNLWQIRINAAEKYRAWSEVHGDVYQIQLGNVPIVVVNSAASAKAIFGQNSQALASRPEFYTFHKVSLEGTNAIHKRICHVQIDSP